MGESNPKLSRRSMLKVMGVSAGALGVELPRLHSHSGVLTPATMASQRGNLQQAEPPPNTDAAAAKQIRVADGEYLTTNQGARASATMRQSASIVSGIANRQCRFQPS